jgi:hypothetical protein
MLPAFAAERCKVDSAVCGSSNACRGVAAISLMLSGIKGIITEWHSPKRRAGRAPVMPI